MVRGVAAGAPPGGRAGGSWTPPSLPLLAPQVQVWRAWVRWLVGTVFAGRDLVVLNLDETSCPHDYPANKGNVVASFRREHLSAGCFFQRVRRADTRGHTTLIGLICNDPILQRHLPQIILGGSAKRPLSAEERAEFLGLGYPLELWEGSGGWTNETVMMAVLAHIKAVVHGHRPGAWILLAMDAASQHVSRRVLAFAARSRIFILLVPGQLTWLLQPLDTRVFGLFKRLLADEHRRLRAVSPDGVIPPRAWIGALGMVTHLVLVGRDWSWAFPTVGLGLAIEGASSQMARYAAEADALEPRPPTAAEIDDVCGRHRINLLPLLLNGPCRLAAGAPPLALPAPPLAALPGMPVGAPLLGFAHRHALAARRRRLIPAAARGPGAVLALVGAEPLAEGAVPAVEPISARTRSRRALEPG